MSATNFTPIQLYRTTTAAAIPTAGNLAAGELGINLTDERLYFKNAAGVVKLLASNSGALGTVTSVDVSGGTTGLTTSGGPITSSGTITLAGTLGVANGGTGATTFTANGVVYGNTTSALLVTAAGTTGQVLVGNTGGAPSWATLSGIGVTSFSGGTTGLTPNTATTGVVTLAGTLGVANGGTGTATAFTAGSVVFAGASGVYSQDNANFFWDDTNNRLGIGTVTPPATLSAVSSSNGSIMFLRRGGGTYNPGLYVNLSDTINNEIIFNTTYSTGNAPSYVWQNADAEIMRLNNTGLGIGTASPSSKFVVSNGGAAGFEVNPTGSASAPALYSYNRSTNAYDILTTLASEVRWQTGSSPSERMRIDSSGNVGIGVSSALDRLTVQGANTGVGISGGTGSAGSPAYTNLSYRGYLSNRTAVIRSFDQSGSFAAGGGLEFLVNQNMLADTLVSVMRITADLNVGIGTSSPAQRLDVTGSANSVQARFGNVAGRGLTIGTTTVSGTNDAGVVFNAPTTEGSFIFQTVSAERMRITQAGDVGIGTSSPGQRLDVTVSSGTEGDGLAVTNLFTSGGSGGYGSGINFFSVRSDGTTKLGSGAIRMVGAASWSDAGSTSSSMRFYTVDANTLAERMRLDNLGQLGIGCVPGYRLDVAAGDTTGNIGYAMRLRSNPTATAAALQFTNSAVSVENGVISCTDAGALTIVAGGGSSSIRFRTNGAERAAISSDGHFGIGTSARLGTNETLSVSAISSFDGMWVKNLESAAATTFIWNAGTSGDNLFIAFGTEAAVTNRGSITYNRAGGLVAYNVTSDYRAKDIIGPVTDAGATIDALKVYIGKMKGATIARPMLVAHEAQEVVPYAVTGEKDAVNEDGTDKHQQIDHSTLIPLLIAELQSLRARVAQLEGN